MTKREILAINLGILLGVMCITIAQELSYSTTAWYVVTCAPRYEVAVTVDDLRHGIQCPTGFKVEPITDFNIRMKLFKYQMELVWYQIKEDLNEKFNR